MADPVNTAATAAQAVQDAAATAASTGTVAIDSRGQPIVKQTARVWPWIVAGALGLGAAYVVYRVAKAK